MMDSNTAALRIQRCWRCYAARAALRALRRQRAHNDCTLQEWDAARMIQRQWRRASGASGRHPRANASRNLLQQKVRVLQRAWRNTNSLVRTVRALRVHLKERRDDMNRNIYQHESASLLQQHWRQYRKARRGKQSGTRVEDPKHAAHRNVLLRFVWLVRCKRLRAAARGKRQLAQRAVVEADAAVAIQGVARKFLRTSTEAHRARELAARNIGAWAKRCLARLDLQRRRYRKATVLRTQRINSAAQQIQAVVRGAFARQAYLSDIRRQQSAGTLQRVCRAAMARTLLRALSRGRLETTAAVRLQRCAVMFLARAKLQRVNAQTRLDVEALRRQQAASVIQRNWHVVLAKNELHHRQQAQRRAHEAAASIQRWTRGVLGKWYLRRERAEREQLNVEFVANAAAVLLQARVRGMLARIRANQMLRCVNDALCLVAACFAAYSARRQLQRVRATRELVVAVRAIQRGWRHHHGQRLARMRAVARQEYVAVLERRNHGAACIQRHIRGRAGRKAAVACKTQSSSAAVRIQGLCRQFLARRVMKRLLEDRRRHMHARKIQTTWLATRDTVIAKRVEREMCTKLRRIYVSQALREESVQRAAIVHDHANTMSDLTVAFLSAGAEAAAAAAARSKVRVECAHMRNDAACEIQSCMRGALVRRRKAHQAAPPSPSASDSETTVSQRPTKLSPVGAADSARLSRSEVIMLAKTNSPLLTVVDACRMDLDDAGARSLFHALRNNTTVVSVLLDGNRLTDSAAGDCALLLKFNSTIARVSLRGNLISTTGATVILSAIKTPNVPTAGLRRVVVDVRNSLVTRAMCHELLALTPQPPADPLGGVKGTGRAGPRRSIVAAGASFGGKRMPTLATSIDYSVSGVA